MRVRKNQYESFYETHEETSHTPAMQWMDHIYILIFLQDLKLIHPLQIRGDTPASYCGNSLAHQVLCFTEVHEIQMKVSSQENVQ